MNAIQPQPSPALLTATGHALLRAIVAGHSAPLQAAAGALERLANLLPGASAECRLTAVLMSLSIEPTSPTIPTDQSVDAVPPPARARRQGRAGKTGKTSRPARSPHRSKPASQPVLDAAGRLQPSKETVGVAVVSQSTARQALGMTCVQMLKLEDQRLLQRIQEAGLRYVWYSVSEVQKLLDLLDRGVSSAESGDTDAPTDAMA